jgi:superfamily I DNA/RNA helicase
LYNNLKGSIVDFIENKDDIIFTVEVNTVFNSADIENAPFILEPPLHKDKSVVSFSVKKLRSSDIDDDGEDNVVPFQVAYAVSIHKAQGLEYDSVKIIITDEVEELISHNIFYTAITRAKKKLKIYWTKSAEQHILGNMHFMFNKRDALILTKKFDLK